MILVVGTGRCGSSCIARILQERLDVDMGGPGRIRAGNPHGDYEDIRFKEEIDNPFERGDISRQEWREEALTFAAGKEEPWGIKDPKNALFLDTVITTLCPDAIIWAWRKPEDVVDSMGRRYASDNRRGHWRQTWGRICALRYYLQNVPHLFVDMTERRDEDELEQAIRTYLKGRGVL